MGSGMAKYSYKDTYYKKRRIATNSNKCFSKEYSEYWKSDPKPSKNDVLKSDKNEYNFSNASVYDSPLRNNRRQSSFVSSFSQPENSTSSGYSSSRSSCKFR